MHLCSLPIPKIVVSDAASPLKASLDVQAVCSGILSVDVPEETLKLSDLFVPDVVPYCKHGEVSPELALTFRPSVRHQSSPETTSSASGRHPNLESIVPLGASCSTGLAMPV